jgi:hypothetical protein
MEFTDTNWLLLIIFLGFFVVIMVIIRMFIADNRVYNSKRVEKVLNTNEYSSFSYTESFDTDESEYDDSMAGWRFPEEEVDAIRIAYQSTDELIYEHRVKWATISIWL